MGIVCPVSHAFMPMKFSVLKSGSASEPILYKTLVCIGFFSPHLHCVQMLSIFVSPQSPAAWQYKPTVIHKFLCALAIEDQSVVVGAVL